MPPSLSCPQTGAFPIERSSYYQQWLEERAHVQRNRWYLSERAGHDVGYGYAQWNWITCHREAWIAAGRPPLS